MNSISGILGAISIIGVLIFLAGVGLAVMSVSQGRTLRNGVMLAIVGIVIAALFAIVGSGLLIVQPQEVAVIFNVLSGNLEDPRYSGTSIIVPGIQQPTIYPIRQQEYTMSGSSSAGARQGDDAVVARTQDGQEVLIDVTVLYNLNAGKEQINRIHERWQNTYQDQFVRPTVRSLIRNIISNYGAEEIYGAGRSAMEQDITDVLTEAFQAEGLELTSMLIRDVTFSPDFVAAIEGKVVAQQNLQRARTDAQTAQTTAEGRANAAIEAANGEAQAIVLRAQAEAQALELVSRQIESNPALIQYLYVQNLSDNVELVLLPSNSPFLFDLPSLTGGTTLRQPEPEATTTPGS